MNSMLKKTRFLALTGFLTVFTLSSLIAQDPTKDSNIKVSTQDNASATSHNDVDMKKLSEAFGHFIGRNLKSPGVSFDLDSIIKGMRDGAEGKPAPMSDQEYETMMLKVQEQAFSKLSEDNLKAADTFMAKNAQDGSIKSIVPGKLQYLIIQEGTGPVVSEHGSPSIKYTAKYIDGTLFDSSDAAGGPITIPLDQTIPGFSKGIAGMKEGEKRRLFIHPDLAYGKTGQLPPNSALIFEVEVVKAAGDTKNLGDLNDEDDDSLLLDEQPKETSKSK